MDVLEGFSHVCPICGKEFLARADYVYKCNVGNKLTYFCSWSCIRKHEKNVEQAKAARKKKDDGRCSYCGAALNPKDKFCHECGKGRNEKEEDL